MSDCVGKVIPVQKKSQDELIKITIEDLAVIYRLRGELKNCRNELCLKCGRYKEAYKGACDDCRYRRGGEWEFDLK